MTNYAGFGWRIPTSATVESKNRTEKADVKFKTQTGLSFDYAGTFESGFSMRGIIDLNYSGSDLKVGFDEGDEMMGINFMLLAGVGYAPVRTEKNVSWTLRSCWRGCNDTYVRGVPHILFIQG